MCAVSSGMIVYVTSTLHGRICTYLVHIVRTSQGFCMCLCVHISNSQTTYERKKDNNSRKTKFLVFLVSRRKKKEEEEEEEEEANKKQKISCVCRSKSHGRAVVSLLLCCSSAAAVWSSSWSLSWSSSQDEDRLDLRLDLRALKTTIFFLIVACTQRTKQRKGNYIRRIVIAAATLVILDLHLRRALLPYEDAAATAASGPRISSWVDRWDCRSACYLGVIKNRRGRLKMWLGESLRLLKTIPEHVGFTSHPARETGRPTAARLGPRARRALCTCSLQKTAFVKKILNRGSQELREVLRGLCGTTLYRSLRKLRKYSTCK